MCKVGLKVQQRKRATWTSGLDSGWLLRTPWRRHLRQGVEPAQEIIDPALADVSLADVSVAEDMLELLRAAISQPWTPETVATMKIWILRLYKHAMSLRSALAVTLRGGRGYDAFKLIEAFMLADLLKRDSSLSEACVRGVRLALGPAFGDAVAKLIEEKGAFYCFIRVHCRFFD